MMWKEFEKLAGYEVSYETYHNVIEPMYMALPESVSKMDFIGMLNKKAFALPTRKELVKEMKKIASFLFDHCGISSYWEERDRLEDLALKFVKQFYGEGYSFFTNTQYGYCGTIQRQGCSFPYEVVIFNDNGQDVERITLVKI